MRKRRVSGKDYPFFVEGTPAAGKDTQRVRAPLPPADVHCPFFEPRGLLPPGFDTPLRHATARS